jgi:hypothetical protein
MVSHFPNVSTVYFHCLGILFLGFPIGFFPLMLLPAILFGMRFVKIEKKLQTTAK